MLGRRDDGSTPPDLSTIPKEAWAAVLRPLPPRTRRRAVWTAAEEDRGDGWILCVDLEEEDADRLPSRDIPIPTLPGGEEVPAVPPRRQVNFRMEASEHARLQTLAEHLAMRPATLARLLVIRGVDQALRSRRTG